MEKELTIKIGGEAGQGIVTIGNILSNLFVRGGWYVFSSQDYESRIRGGHNIFQLRASKAPMMSMSDRVDVLIALNQESVDLHLPELHEKGIVIYDGETIKAPEREKGNFFGIPIDRLAKESGGAILANTVAVAATLGLLGYEMKSLEDYLHITFRKKGEEVIRENVKAAHRGYEEAMRISREKGNGCPFQIKPQSVPAKMLISGNEGLALGALAAGCKFYTGYPMTPSTGILTYMASKADQFGVVVEQAEDEIAAINMAIGASFAGARAMTGTSGGGFDLMTEGLSLAGMTETPVVIVLGQRPGPATGLPTRTEQGELLYTIRAGHGEFPRLVLAPGTPEQAFYLAVRAFDQAEKYQIPVIILTDQYLTDSYFSYDTSFDLENITINRYLLSEDELNHLEGDYRRHAFTETGISPRAVPGQSSRLVMTDSDEHDQYGHIIEDMETRQKEVEKRMRKLKTMEQDILPPDLYGPSEAKTMLLCWGSAWGIVHEVMNTLNEDGRDVAMVHYTHLWPFPDRETIRLLKGRDRLISIEYNAYGQLAYLIHAQTGIAVDRKIQRTDGRPFSTGHLYETIREVMS
ncbi:MAG: 2-oxoacid:acceptor oxidoreductase subunit alpha [bacterium]